MKIFTTITTLKIFLERKFGSSLFTWKHMLAVASSSSALVGKRLKKKVFFMMVIMVWIFLGIFIVEFIGTETFQGKLVNDIMFCV